MYSENGWQFANCGLLALQIWKYTITYCSVHWNTELAWTIHILCEKLKIIRIITNCCHTDAGRRLNGYNANYNWKILPHNDPGRCTQIAMVTLGESEYRKYSHTTIQGGAHIVMVTLGGSEYLTNTHTHCGFQIMTQRTCLYKERARATSTLTVRLWVV
jgi:hypothetical protein